MDHTTSSLSRLRHDTPLIGSSGSVVGIQVLPHHVTDKLDTVTVGELFLA